MITRRKAAVAAAAVLLLGGAPILAEEEGGSSDTATATILINVEAEPLEISIDPTNTMESDAVLDGTNITWNFVPGQSEGVDYGATGVIWNVDVRTSSGSEKAKITQSSPGLDDPSILNDLVIESTIYVQGNPSTEGTAANKLVGGATQPCGYALTFRSDSPPGPRERLGCRGMNPGFDSIDGTDDTTLELEIYGYLAGAMGPTQRGTIEIGLTWIIEAYPDDEEPEA